jgi:transposase
MFGGWSIAMYQNLTVHLRSASRRRPQIGMVPRQYQSGETDRYGRTTKRGARLLRTMLMECAWFSRRYNPWARAREQAAFAIFLLAMSAFALQQHAL